MELMAGHPDRRIIMCREDEGFPESYDEAVNVYRPQFIIGGASRAIPGVFADISRLLTEPHGEILRSVNVFPPPPIGYCLLQHKD